MPSLTNLHSVAKDCIPKCRAHKTTASMSRAASGARWQIIAVISDTLDTSGQAESIARALASASNRGVRVRCILGPETAERIATLFSESGAQALRTQTDPPYSYIVADREVVCFAGEKPFHKGWIQTFLRSGLRSADYLTSAFSELLSSCIPC